MLKDWPFYPIMLKTSHKTHILKRIDEWLVASHKDGSLRRLFEAMGNGSIYPAEQLDAAVASETQ